MATRVAQYCSYCLPESHRETLHNALCMLSEDFLAEDKGHPLLAELLPRANIAHYNEGFPEEVVRDRVDRWPQAGSVLATGPVSFPHGRGVGQRPFPL